MKRPRIPTPIWEVVNEQSRAHEDWYETLERLLEQEVGLTIPSKAEVKAE